MRHNFKLSTTAAPAHNLRFDLATRMIMLAGVLSCASAPALSQGGVINDRFNLIASDPGSGDLFGFSTALNNGIVVIGARLDDDNGLDSGSAYLFDVFAGTPIAKLLPSDGAANDFFGHAVAIGNGIVAVGAHLDDDNGNDSGAVYLFDALSGAQLAKLVPSDGTVNTHFGVSIAIDNGIIAIGANGDNSNGAFSGAAYLFNAFTGTQFAKLVPSDGASFNQFGLSISISSGIVAVGSPFDDDNGASSGSVYLFNAFTGAPLAKLLPSDGAFGDQFGRSVAIHNGTVAAGALADTDNGFLSGSAYLFDANTGAQIAKLLPSDGAFGDQFGSSISINNGVVAVGSPSDDDNGNGSGSVYLFDAYSGAQTLKLLPSNGAAQDAFGISTAMDNGVIVAGAFLDDDQITDSGSAYVFDANSCPADLNSDGILDSGDIAIFIALFLAGDLAADLSADGITDNADISAFIAFFLAGC